MDLFSFIPTYRPSPVVVTFSFENKSKNYSQISYYQRRTAAFLCGIVSTTITGHGTREKVRETTHRVVYRDYVREFALRCELVQNEHFKYFVKPLIVFGGFLFQVARSFSTNDDVVDEIRRMAAHRVTNDSKQWWERWFERDRGENSKEVLCIRLDYCVVRRCRAYKYISIVCTDDILFPSQNNKLIKRFFSVRCSQAIGRAERLGRKLIRNWCCCVVVEFEIRMECLMRCVMMIKLISIFILVSSLSLSLPLCSSSFSLLNFVI